jgi:VanZ family protein
MYFLSTDVFSGEQTRGFLERILRWLRPGISEYRIHWANVFVRKSAHFFEYALLAGLIYRAFRADAPVHWRPRWAIYTIILFVSWALVDEFHQSFTRLRSSSFYDSALDVTGGLFAISIIAIYSIRRDRQEGS